jgi:putative ABC transport system permease protein
MLQDVRFAVRALRRAPAFTAVAILTLGFGIGATTAMFNVLSSVLLHPLPYANADRLVVLMHEGQFPVSPADYADYRSESHSFTTVAAAQAWGATISGDGDPERLDGLQITPDLFPMVGGGAAIGRTFTADEARPGRDHVVVITHAFWQRRFGGESSAVGRTIRLDGDPYTIVGVMPEGFGFAPFWVTNASVFKPLELSRRGGDRAGRSLRVFARLRDGIAGERAQADVSAIAARLASAYPETNAHLGITVVPLREKVVGGVRPLLLLLFSTTALVLLIACVNVASLQLVRGAARQRELAVRTALGAGRGRLVRQLVAETLVLSAAGGGLGVLIAAWGMSWIARMLPPGSVPRQQEIAFEPFLLLVALALVAAATIVAGLAPAVQLSRADVHDALKDAARGATEGTGRRRLRRGLVAVELALAMALVAGAGLMSRTMLRLTAVDPGFDPQNLLTFTVSADGTPHADPLRRAGFFDDVGARLRQLPGVVAVSAINHLPLAGDTWRFQFHPEGRPEPPRADAPSATWRVVEPGYFAAMRLPLARGREFTSADREDAPLVAIVNETMAREHWPQEDPLGRRVRVGMDATDPMYTIVGIARNARQSDWTAPIPEEIYVPYAQHAGEFGGTGMTFVVRTAGDPLLLSTAARRAVWNVDASAPVSNLASMAEVVADKLWRARASALLVGLFAAIALGLATLGLYGVGAYAMSRRTREIGIRMALGARPGQVMRLAFAETLGPVLVGLAVGTAAALIVARLGRNLLYGIGPGDPVTFAGGALILAASALAAGWLPARRASRIDPLTALREE